MLSLGLTTLTVDLSTKQLQLLKEAIPGASRIALVVESRQSMASGGGERHFRLAVRSAGSVSTSARGVGAAMVSANHRRRSQRMFCAYKPRSAIVMAGLSLIVYGN